MWAWMCVICFAYLHVRFVRLWKKKKSQTHCNNRTAGALSPFHEVQVEQSLNQVVFCRFLCVKYHERLKKGLLLCCRLPCQIRWSKNVMFFNALWPQEAQSDPAVMMCDSLTTRRTFIKGWVGNVTKLSQYSLSKMMTRPSLLCEVTPSYRKFHLI